MSMIHQPMYIILKKKRGKHSDQNDQTPFLFFKEQKMDHLINILLNKEKTD